MNKLTSQQIRTTWLNFFKSKGHMIEPGASLIPHNDPTLLWINAGVAALKKYFDGSEIPESKRITNVQKCIRTNDIENVGKTARHHTFFEMLGNFSIGDYFRNEVIPWAFDLLTNPKYFGIEKDKLYITYHPSDKETKELWIKQGMDESHLIPLTGNFWQIGEGPCGPNTEVFFDRGIKYDKDNLGIKLLEDDIENDRYIEIWGIVFSQYNAVNGVKREDYKELPHKNIDTGAGLERIACVLQETETNFETDLFMPTIKKIQELCKKPYENEYLMPYRVIADHIRTCVFALSDGEVFSNEGRGYVLRRLLRRAMRYAQKLDLYEPFMYKLVRTVIETMKDFYPYLVGKEDFLEKMIKNEEEKFIKTLNKGEALLNEFIKGKTILDGKDAFKLYDTYGFPLELTKEIALDNNCVVDEEGFNECLNKQKELARNSRKNIDSFAKQSKDLLEFNIPSTYTYLDDVVTTKVIGLFKDGIKQEIISEEGEIAFETTNFYAEMGGEISDTGYIYNSNFRANVIFVSKAPNGEHLHKIKVLYGEIKENDEVTLVVDHIRHFNIMKNHSATHLLQSALIKVLGEDIKQKGSLVTDSYLRFDFSHLNKISDEDLDKIEKTVNEYINDSIERKTLILPLDEAKKIGAKAEFDGKYGSTVRVVTFDDVSKEFCGGCHVNNTSDIGIFAIKSESSIASGVRRIEAVTGISAYNYLKEKDRILANVKHELEVKSVYEVEQKLSSVKNELLNTKQNITALNSKIAAMESKSLLSEFKIINNKNVLIKVIDGSLNNLMNLYDSLKVKLNDYIICLIGNDSLKHPLLIGVSDSYVKNGIKANILIKEIGKILGGNGGGKDNLAKGSVVSIENINKLEGIF